MVPNVLALFTLEYFNSYSASLTLIPRSNPLDVEFESDNYRKQDVQLTNMSDSIRYVFFRSENSDYFVLLKARIDMH